MKMENEQSDISSILNSIEKKWKEIAQHPLKNRITNILDDADKKHKQMGYHYDSPKAYQRTKKHPITVKGILKRLSIKIEITAKPEDWNTIRDFYAVFKKEFYHDVFPFIQSAYFKTLPKKTVNESKQHFIEILKVQSAILYDFLSSILKLPEHKQPASFKAIKEYKFEDEVYYEDINDDTVTLTQYLINAVYSEWIDHNKIKGWYDKEGILNTENFLITYIQGGHKMIKTDIEKAKNRLQFMNILLYDDLTGYDECGVKKKTNPVLNFLVNISRAINIKYRSEINPDIISPSIKNPKELDSIREILKKLYPSVSFPLS